MFLALGVVWLTVTSTVASGLFVFYGIAAGADTSSTLGRHIVSLAIFPMFLVALIAAAGPLGVWLFRRTRPWLLAGLIVLGLGLLNTFFVYARSL